jgi:hypothetical protein
MVWKPKPAPIGTAADNEASTTVVSNAGFSVG